MCVCTLHIPKLDLRAIAAFHLISLVNWGNGGQRGTPSQLRELGQWRPERYSFTAEGTGAMEAREVLLHS